MQLPNWFKIAWWVLILFILSYFLYKRYPDVITGKASTLDALALIIWIALALAPIFKEINLFGFKLKQEIESLKEEVRDQITNLQSEIRTNIRSEISPRFTFLHPPPDKQLPELEERIKSAVQDVIKQHGIQLIVPKPEELAVEDDVQSLFAARHNIEKELRRILASRFGEEIIRRPMSILQMAYGLVIGGLIEPGLANAIREVYAVCSSAIHGKPVTEAQIAFVREVAPQLIAALKAII